MSKWIRALVVLAALLPGAIQAATRYVEPGNPVATDSGAGDALHPYRTLTYAMKNLKPGDVLNIAGGVYRESILFPSIAWTGAATLIQPVAGATVTIKGSDVVTGWQAVGPGLFVKNGWTANSQQVFLDGVALKQIGGTIFGGYPTNPGSPYAAILAGQGGIWPGRVPGGLAQMTNRSFYYDAGLKSLYIKVPLTSLQGHTVEASVRPRLVFGQALNNVTLRNLRFQHSNTTALNQTGAITIAGGSRIVLERLEVTYCDGAGFDVTADESVIRNSKANSCGQLGIKARGRANTLHDNETSYNNTRGFNKWWEAGGAKFTGNGGLVDSDLYRHRAIGNNGDGIWFDWMNRNNRIHDSVSAYNAGFGIHYEASQKADIYDNYVFSNKQRGIYLAHSTDSLVAFNLVSQNGLEGIAVIDEGRSPTNTLLRPRRNRVHGNILSWNGKAAVVLPAGLYDNTSDYNLFLGSAQPVFSLGWSPLYTGLAAWRTASRQDAHSWFVSMALPSSLAIRQPSPDWKPVRTIALQYTVPTLAGLLPQPTAHQPHPGPE